MSIATVGFERYDWGVGDMRKFSDRLDDRLTKALGIPAEPPADADPIDYDAIDQRIREERLAKRAQILLKRLDPLYREATPHHDMSRRWLEAYRAGRCVNLLIGGGVNVGKTWEAAAIARDLLLSFVPVTFVNAGKMMQSMRPNQDGMSDLGQFQAAPVLMIDDLGAEKRTEWTAEQLYLLADYRHNHCLPTIITTNLSLDKLDSAGQVREKGQLRAAYDPRTYRRLFQNASLLWIAEPPPELTARFRTTL